MEKALSALANPLTLFMGLMILGFFLGRGGIFTKSFNQSLSFFLLKVTLPCLIFISFQRPFQTALATEALWTFLLSLGCYLFYFFVSLGVSSLPGIPEDRRGIYRFALLFSNVGFMGFPMVEALLGKSMIFFAAIFNIPFQFLSFSLGVMIITQGQNKEPGWWKEVALNPGIIATALGFICFLLSFTLPGPLFTLTDSLGSLTTPLSMVLIGSILASSSVRAVFKIPSLWVVSFFRLAFIPLGVWVITLLVDLNPQVERLAILISAMPAAANTPIFAAHYRVGDAAASQIVFLTTVMSVVTIPLITVILGFF